MSRRLMAIGSIIGFALVSPPAGGQPTKTAKGKIAPDVYAALEKSAAGTVLVEVTLLPIEGHPRFGHTWALMNQRQDVVLARLEPGEFEVLYRPDHTAPIMVGHASADGLARLVSDPDVVAVKSGKITSDVHPELDKSDDGRAFVCVVLREPAGDRIKEAQDKVLAKLKPEEFQVAWRFETAAMMAGHVSAAGLAKLATAPDVIMVRPSKVGHEAYRELEESADGTTSVTVLLRDVPWNPPRPRAKEEELQWLKSQVKAIQEHVLGVFEPGEFESVRKLHTTSIMHGDVNASGLEKLEAHPDVMDVGGKGGGAIRLNLLESVPFIQADRVHDELGYTGAGITVAVLDTGIDPSHLDVQGDVAPGAYHFLGRIGGGVGPGAVDGHGHGTNLAAIITSPIGVAPDAQILPIKVVDNNLNGHAYDGANVIDYVVDHQNDYPNLLVICMSFHNPNMRPFSACVSR